VNPGIRWLISLKENSSFKNKTTFFRPRKSMNRQDTKPDSLFSWEYEMHRGMDYEKTTISFTLNETQTTLSIRNFIAKKLFSTNIKMHHETEAVDFVPRSVGSIQKFVPRQSLRPKLEEVSTDGRKECCRKRGTFWAAALAPVFSNHVWHHMAGGSIIHHNPSVPI